MGKKILLVDDDDACRAVCERELSGDGYEVFHADSGPAALRLLEKQSVDLVILDIRMPGMDGLEVLGRILAVSPGLPIVFYSAFDCYRENFLSWAAESYIAKSPDISELKKKVGEILKG